METHQVKIIEAAKKLGIKVELLEDQWQMDIARLTWKDKSTFVIAGRIFSHINTVADQIGANKIASKALMSELGIPVPKHIILDADNLKEEEITSFLKKHYTVVTKPVAGVDGRGVAMHLNETKQIVDHINNTPYDYKKWLLEEQVTGEDLRLQYISGKLVAACVRRPCTLTGDGKSTISELIEARNHIIYAQNDDNRIHIDHQVTGRLDQVGLNLDSILNQGQQLQIKDVSNMAQGGHAVDITDTIHPKYEEYLNRLAKVLKLRLFAVDVVTDNPEADPDIHAHVLEFNIKAAWLHHTFSEVRSHDIPSMILKDYFGIA